MAEDTKNFGPLLPKINGKELGKFVYLKLNNSKGNLKIISIENEEELYVNSKEKMIVVIFFFRIYRVV